MGSKNWLAATYPVSIRAPHAGSDSVAASTCNDCARFNPRSPRGERWPDSPPTMIHFNVSIRAPHAGSDIAKLIASHGDSEFQSALPTRGAIRAVLDVFEVLCVSIRAPHAGSDRTTPVTETEDSSFNPRSPRGERYLLRLVVGDAGCFNPRSPRGERCSAGHRTRLCLGVSIRAPHAGSDE